MAMLKALECSCSDIMANMLKAKTHKTLNSNLNIEYNNVMLYYI